MSELRRPKLPVFGEPLIYGLKWLGIELINAMTPKPPFANQLCAEEDAEMLGNGRPRDRKRLGDFSRRLVAPPEHLEHGTARRIAQRVKRRVH
jgi:hypothetical protein